MNIKMYCLCLLNLFLHLKLKILEQNTKFNDLTMNSNEQVLDKKHKYCKICRGRLDRVKKYSRVQDTQLIKKLIIYKLEYRLAILFVAIVLNPHV